MPSIPEPPKYTILAKIEISPSVVEETRIFEGTHDQGLLYDLVERINEYEAENGIKVQFLEYEAIKDVYAKFLE